MPSDAPFLVGPNEGDPGISATYLERVKRLASRSVYGPGVIATAEGFFVVPTPSSGGGGSNTILCVMRELNVSTPICTMQEVDYDTEASKEVGEDAFPFHVAAVSDIFEVVPPPTFTYAQFNIEGALRDPDDADDPENLSAAILWQVDVSRDLPWAWAMAKSVENLINITPT